MISSRKTILLFLGSAALLTGFYLTLDKLKDTLEGQLADRLTQAVDQLRDEHLDVRLGGIYALEQIARSSEKNHWPIMEILTAYVRERAPWKATLPVQTAPQPPRLAADIQTILTVMGRRTRTYNSGETKRLDLRKTDLRRADLSGAHLEGVILSEAHLEGATLNTAHLEDAILRETHLEGALLIGAYLERAFLGSAYLTGASLREASLEGAFLNGARLDGADLLGADLTDANGLTWEQLKTARKDNRTRLPAYLALTAR